MSVDDEDAVIVEPSWTETVRIDIHVDPAATLAAFCQRADLHHLALGADGDVAVGAIVRAGDDFGRNEAAHLAQPGHRRTSGYDGTASVKHDPNLTLSRHDRGLIHEAEQTAALVAGLRPGTRGFCDIGNDVETQPAIGAQRDRHSVAHVEKVSEEKVAEFVEGQARITTRGSQVVVGSDDSRGPAGAAVEANGRKHTRCRDDDAGDGYESF